MTRPIYLDYAAATPVDQNVLKAMQPYFSEHFENPSAVYLSGRDNRLALNNARGQIAKMIGARPVEIIFTSGATEANNLVIQGVMRAYPAANLLTSSVEHESVLAPARLFRYKQIPVNKFGMLDLDKLVKLIDDQTVLISVIMVNNELGTLQDLPQIARLIKAVRERRRTKAKPLPLWLHTDAAQAANYFDLKVTRLGVDLLTVNGGKIYGPKQTGFLYVRSGVDLQPLILGGGQEFGLRSGTENLPGAVGLAKALELTQLTCNQEAKRIQKLKYDFVEQLVSSIPQVIINTNLKHSAPHIVNVSFPGIDGERLMMELDERGITVAVGSACSAADEEPSHVLRAIGLSDDLARSSLRFSFGRHTKAEELTQTIKILTKLLN